MKYNIILLLFFTSCINSSYINKNNFTYSSKGFAYIENHSFNNVDSNFFAAHNNLNLGTKIRISNPDNKESIEVTIKKKIKYDNFYKVLISGDIAEKLKLNLSFPYIEVTEVKKNKSFIAKKAVTDNAEKEIANKAPIDHININNISKKIIKETKKIKTFSILVAEFYSLESAKSLNERLIVILKDSNYQQIQIKKNNKKSYYVLMGPYNTINKLKNDYITLSDSNFEDLDIIKND